MLLALAGAVLLPALLATYVQAAPDRVQASTPTITLAAAHDAGPDADLDAMWPAADAEINDPALDNGDCRVAPGGRARAPLASAILFTSVLLAAWRRRG